MPTLIYPTLDVFLYDLREGFGQEISNLQLKREIFKRKLPQTIIEQLDFSNEENLEYVELLGQKRHEHFDDSKYKGYYHPVKLGDSYGLLVDCSPKDNQSAENLEWISELKQIVTQKHQNESATLGQTYFFYASTTNVSLEDYDNIAQNCYRALMPNGNWFEDKLGETNFSEGKLFELSISHNQHIVIALFLSDQFAGKIVPNFIQNALKLFWYRHKITWAYSQGLELKKHLMRESKEIQACRKAFQNKEKLSTILDKSHEVFSKYVDLLTGLESQAHTIEINLYNYKQRLLQITDFDYPDQFEQQAKEKYLRQLQTDHISFNSQIKLIENLMSSIHAQEMHKNVEHISAVQTKVEWLEVFFVSFYVAKFTYIMVELWGKSKYTEMGIVFFLAIGGGIIAFIALDLSKHLKQKLSKIMRGK
jgi:hypothetical protein